LRVAFAGTPPFAARALEEILAAGHEVTGVLTQPDRPAGRGLHPRPSAVAEAAARHGLVLLKPESLRDPEAVERVRALRPEVMVVAAYGLILPQPVLDLPARGCLNIHASLLPRWRGAAPIQRALLAGDAVTGVTIMQMEAGLDTGPSLLAKEIAIGARDTTASLTESLAALGAAAIVEALAHLDGLVPRAQDAALATYAAKISKAESRIDWTLAANAIDRLVRAFNPSPGAETRLGKQALKIWDAQPVPGSGQAGEVLEAQGENLVIACGNAALAIHRLQKQGGKRMSTGEFLRGATVARGAFLDAPALSS
jgi:methionyl-tRNA formyltransferase